MTGFAAHIGRRRFLAGASATAAAGALTACSTAAVPGEASGNPARQGETDGIATLELKESTVDFDGVHQAGVVTPAQAHLNLIGFDFVEGVDKQGLTRLMRSWTEDARRLAGGGTPVGSLEPEMVQAPANLTFTVGFGPRAVELAGAGPLAEIPAFSRDQLEEKWGQTDLVLQICGDDPLTVSHATRHMVRTSPTYATPSWMQQGFLHASGTRQPGETPRNLFGQLDGTVNPKTVQEHDEQVWREDGSTVMVVRRIRMDMDEWEMLDRTSREESMGRTLDTGAPLSGGGEFDDPDYEATDRYGLPVIDPASHMARARPAEGHPEQRMLRRAYNYDLPPEAGGLSNSGLVFICFQQNPDEQFTPVQQRLDDLDRLNTWITHIGSAVYWIPPGTTEDAFWAQRFLAV